MRRPRQMNFRKSKRMFSRTAARTHRKNSLRGSRPMRGGIRL
jgi:hypothetical protein